MASVSSSSSTNNNVTSIDVASIVSSLMTVANAPLDKLNSKVKQAQTVISDLGTLKSKLSDFQTALTALETPGNYQNVIATTNNSTVASSSAISGAKQGRYNLNISQTAEASNISVKGFTSLTNAVTLPAEGFTLKVGSTTYSSNINNVGSVSGVTTPALLAGNISDVSNWINSIATNNGLNVSSDLVLQSTGQYALVMNGTQTGIINSVGFSGLNGYSVTTTNSTSTSSSVVTLNGSAYNGSDVSVNSSAKDSVFQVNGLAFQRSSNTVTDVVTKLTLKIDSIGSALITVNQGTDDSSSLINNFVTTYNQMIAQYKTMTANSSNSKETGSLGGQSAALTLSFINEIKLKLGQGALVGSSTISLTTMGVDYTTDGTLKFNKTNYSSGIANGLLSSLSQGISVGGSVGTTNDMSKTIADALNPNGAIDIYVKAKNSDIETTKTRIGDLSTRLRLLETSYTRQYSTLNTLLYNLSQTSNQLTSSLTAVTNINSAK